MTLVQPQITTPSDHCLTGKVTWIEHHPARHLLEDRILLNFMLSTNDPNRWELTELIQELETRNNCKINLSGAAIDSIEVNYSLTGTPDCVIVDEEAFKKLGILPRISKFDAYEYEDMLDTFEREHNCKIITHLVHDGCNEIGFPVAIVFPTIKDRMFFTLKHL